MNKKYSKDKIKSIKEYLYNFPNYWDLCLVPRVCNARYLSKYQIEKEIPEEDWIIFIFKEAKNGVIESTINTLYEAWEMMYSVVDEKLKNNNKRKEILIWRNKLLGHRYKTKINEGLGHEINFIINIASKNLIFDKLLENGETLAEEINNYFSLDDEEYKIFDIHKVPKLSFEKLDSLFGKII